jgi:Na+/proline symporter
MTQPTHKNDNNLAIASLVLGILSLTGASIIAGIPAIITGIMAQKNPANKGMGTAGLIMGIISVVFAMLAIMFILLLIAVGAFAASEYDRSYPAPMESKSSVQRSI